MDGTRYAQRFDNGIAIVDLIGPIFPRANMMTMSGGTSITQFTQDFVKAEADPNVTGVIINIDSPGGDVRGIGDAAKIINAITKQSTKPIKVFVSGFMASAAYYVGSAVGSQNIISSESGLVGSIGVVLTARGKSEDGDIEIVSSQSPYKRPDPSTPDGRAPLQQQVDDLAEIFVRDVSKYRGTTQAKVLSDYGQGAVFVAPRALKQGLVDSIGTLSNVVESMASGAMKKSQRQRTKASGPESLLQFTEEEDTMGLKDMLTRFRASEATLLDEPIEQAQDATAGGAESEATPAAVAPEAPEAETPVVTPAVVPAQAQIQIPTRAALEETFSEGAELFATQMTVSGVVFPAQAAYAASDLLNARIDDSLYKGSVTYIDAQGQLAEGTREQAVRARYAAMPKHTMTQKAVAGIKEGSVAAFVLAETDKNVKAEDKPISAERKESLLKSSAVGQAVVNAAK